MGAPIGAYQLADNTVVSVPDLVEPRRGFAFLNYTYGIITDVANALFSFQGTPLIQYGTALAYDSGASWTALAGTNAPPDPTVLRMQAVEAGQNFYYTSTEGIKKIDTPSSTPVLAGVPRGPAPTRRTVPTWMTGDPDSGWMPANSMTAYTATWVTFDTDGTEHESAPSTVVYVAIPPDRVSDGGANGNLIEKPVGSPIYQIFIPGGHGLHVGDRVTFDYGGAATASFPNGTLTVSALGPIGSPGTSLDITTFQAVDTAPNAGPGTVAPNGTLYAGDKDVSVTFNIAPNITTDYTVRVYRAEASLSWTVPPRPQFYLDHEHQLTAGEVAAGGYTYTDSVPDSLLQDPLYTNTDDGEPPDSSLQNDNSQPPYATDVCLFDSRVWGANYQELQSFNLALLGVGAPNGLQVGDTVTIAGVVYTGRAVGTALAVNEFWVYLLTGSAGTNVQQTAQSLALSVTRNPSSTVDCYYTSGVNDTPGQLLIRGRTPSVGVFSVTASRVSAWGPDLTGGLSSTADAATNGLWFSKQNQPEAVPLLNRLSVGPRNCRILRIQALRDKLYVFTDIAGIWIISNKYPYENVDPLTKTTVLVGPDTLVNFNDALYALTTQGVAKIDDSGPQIISIPIENDIKRLFGTGLATLKVKSVATGYESARKYILAMPTEPSDTYNTQALVYDVVTRCWTRWTKPMAAMVVVPQSDYLYVASPLVNKVSVERKNYDRTDYADEDFPVTIVSSDGLEVVLASVAGITAGDLLYVDPIQLALVLEVDTDTNTVTVQQTVQWTNGGATIYPAIDNKLVYTPMFSGEPESWKRYREVAYHFKTPAFSLGNAFFSSDLNPSEQEVPFALGGFGDPDWERFPWEQPGGPKNKRVGVPTKAQRVAYLSVGFHIRQAWNQWSLAGYTPVFEKGSERETSK